MSTKKPPFGEIYISVTGSHHFLRYSIKTLWTDTGNPVLKLNPLLEALTPLGSLQNRVIKLYYFRSDYIYVRTEFDTMQISGS